MPRRCSAVRACAGQRTASPLPIRGLGTDSVAQLLAHVKLLLRRRATGMAALNAGLPAEAVRHFSKDRPRRGSRPAGRRRSFQARPHRRTSRSRCTGGSELAAAARRRRGGRRTSAAATAAAVLRLESTSPNGWQFFYFLEIFLIFYCMTCGSHCQFECQFAFNSFLAHIATNFANSGGYLRSKHKVVVFRNFT